MNEKEIQLYYGPKTSKRPYTGPYEKVAHSENSYNFFIQDYDDNEIEVMAYSKEGLQIKYGLS